MREVKPSSAHYKSQQQYKQYLQSIKVGDTVYPAYDGKSARCTACKVVDIKYNMLVVEGKLWASQDKVIKALFDINTGHSWIAYVDDEPTLMDYLFDKNEDGDFYQLINFTNYVNDGWFNDEYLKSLGLI